MKSVSSGKTRGSRSHHQRKKKKIAALHYKRRKLDKDVKRYIKENSRLNSKELDEIGTRNGFYFG